MILPIKIKQSALQVGNKGVYTTIILFLLTSYIYGKDFIFNDVTIEDGLSSNKIACILEDSLGRIWMGTDNGLNCYNGTTITTFFSDNENNYSITHNIVNALEKHKNNSKFWVGTSKGLSLFDIQTEKAATVPESIDKDGILKIAAINDLSYDQEGRLWLACNTNVYCLDTTLFNITQNINVSSREKRYTAIFVSPNNEVYIGGERGIYKYNPNSMLLDHLKFHDPMKRIKKMYLDSDGDLWVGTAVDGAYLFKNADLSTTPTHFSTANHTMLSDMVWDFEEYSKDQLFIVNKEAGITIYNKRQNTFEYITADPLKPYGLEDKAITQIFKDSQGNLWVGTFTSGISYIDNFRKPFTHYTQGLGNSNLFNDNVRSFFEDSEGYIWVGIKQNGGLSRFDPRTKTFKHYFFDRDNPQGLRGENVTCINEIDKRYLMVGTFLEGLHILDRKTGLFKQYMPNPDDPKAITDHYIITIDKYSDHKFLIGHGFGLDMFDAKTCTFTQIYGDQSARSCYVEGVDSIWFGTLKELYLLSSKGEINKRYTVENYRKQAPYSINTNYIAAIDEDSKGNIWIGGGNDGLFKLAKDRQHFIKCKFAIERSTNRLKGMVIDDKDNVWFSTKEGIFCYKQAKDQYDRYTKYDGLQSNEFETHAALKLRDGQLLFGGRNGFNMFHPDSIHKNENLLDIEFQTLKIANKMIRPGDESGILSKHINFTKEITLNHNQSMLSFVFSAIGYSAAEKTNYAYYMEGVDEEWNDVGHNRSATYINLHPGHYTFKVKAANNDGLWNETSKDIHIRILPPWWRTPLFYVLLVVMIIVLIWFIVYLRIKQLQQQQITLKLKVDERTRELYNTNKQLAEQALKLDQSNQALKKLNDTKNKLFSIIAHDLRNPLSSILGISDLLDKNYDRFEEERRRQLIQSIAVSMRSTFQLLENMLNWSRSQSQSLKVLIKEVNPHQEIEKIEHLIHTDLTKKNLTLTNKIPEDYSFNTDPNLFEVIFRNLITNALKFSSEGDITITFAEDSNTISISITDCGVGMSSETIANIFKETYTESKVGTQGETGTGLGLSVCKEFIHKLQGELKIKSKLGEGSTFEVVLPKHLNA